MNEEIELRIFDYLEGNLNEPEAEEVRQLVQQHPEWSRVYRLMQHTYLDAADWEATFQFPDKELLYRNSRKPRLYLLYYSAAASLFLCGLTYLFWKSGAAAVQVAVLPQEQEVAALKPEKRQPSTPQFNAALLRPDSAPLPEQLVNMTSEPQAGLAVEVADSFMPVSLTTRRPGPTAISLQGPYPSGAMRFINGNYVPLKQRRSLLRFRLLEEGRELLAWVSEPRLMLVRTERAGARDRMELRIETKKIGIIATITD
jgi:hypothetical protein